MRSRQILLIALIAFASAIAGVFVGREVSETPRPGESELHAFLHDELQLTPKQKQQIDALEKRYADQRQVLERKMKAANARLAAAIKSEHGYGPEVTTAIEHSHDMMGELQQQTLEHLFTMRALLNPKQTQLFDTVVDNALTADAR